jgi:branched-subunit amino acid transport protein
MREPARIIGAISGLITAVLTACVALGVLPESKEKLIETAIAALLALLGPIIGAELTRSQVTPTNAPVLAPGTDVTTPAGNKATVKTV